MTAPTRPPYFYRTLGYEDDGRPALDEVRLLIDTFAGIPEHFPDWIAEDVGVPVRLTLVSHMPGERAEIGLAAMGHEAVLELTPDPSGWMLLVGRHAGAEVFRAYLDRPYEEYEFWPPGARPGEDEEGPGRVGKSGLWVSLHVLVWPKLRNLANELGGVNVAVDETRLRDRTH